MTPPTETELDTFYRSLGRRIRIAREALTMTQEQLARHLDLTRTSVANLEAGRQRISAYSLAVAARSLGVAVADLCPSLETQPVPELSGADPEHVALLRQLLATTNTEERDGST